MEESEMARLLSLSETEFLDYVTTELAEIEAWRAPALERIKDMARRTTELRDLVLLRRTRQEVLARIIAVDQLALAYARKKGGQENEEQ